MNLYFRALKYVKPYIFRGLCAAICTAIAAGGKLYSFFSCIFDALATTMATFAGQNMGAQRPDRVSKGLGQGVLVSLSMTLVLCLCQIFGISLIIRAFQLDEAAAAICRLHLFSSAVAIPIFAVYFPANGMCQGVGEGFHATFYALLALGLRVVFAYALHKTSLFGYTAIWWSQAMSWTITLVVCYVHFFRGKWKDKSLIS